MEDTRYVTFLRERITQIRIQKDISEHAMSMHLGKSGSYIRSITSGRALPSVKELFNIMEYFEMTPAEFFAPLDDADTIQGRLREELHGLNEEELEKVRAFVSWIRK